MDSTADVNAQIQSILGSGAPTPSVLDPMSQTVAFNPSDFNIPNLSTYIQQAYQALAPYYNQILQQAQGDYNAAIQVLNNQYDISTYATNAQAALSNYQTNQNLTAALEQLHVQFPEETQQLLNSLNQRGIATTQAGPGPAPTQLNVAGEGEGGYEMSNLTSDQSLRQEAVQRSAQQQQQNTALSQQTSLLSANQSLQSGTLTQQENLRNQQQSAEQGLESGTISMAQSSAQNAIAQQQLAEQQKQDQLLASGGGAGAKPPMPTPGTNPYQVGQQMNGYRWTGVQWDPLS